MHSRHGTQGYPYGRKDYRQYLNDRLTLYKKLLPTEKMPERLGICFNRSTHRHLVWGEQQSHLIWYWSVFVDLQALYGAQPLCACMDGGASAECPLVTLWPENLRVRRMLIAPYLEYSTFGRSWRRAWRHISTAIRPTCIWKNISESEGWQTTGIGKCPIQAGYSKGLKNPGNLFQEKIVDANEKYSPRTGVFEAGEHTEKRSRDRSRWFSRIPPCTNFCIRRPIPMLPAFSVILHYIGSSRPASLRGKSFDVWWVPGCIAPYSSPELL